MAFRMFMVAFISTAAEGELIVAIVSQAECNYVNGVIVTASMRTIVHVTHT